MRSVTKYLNCVFCFCLVAALNIATAEQKKQSAEQTDSKPKPFVEVSITGLKEEKLLNNAYDFIDINNTDSIPHDDEYIRYLAERGKTQIQQALEPFGYYLANVELSMAKKNKQWRVRYNVDKGFPLILRNLDLKINGDGKREASFIYLFMDYPLRSGDIFDQQKYTTFKDDVVNESTSKGYFDGVFTSKEIRIAEGYRKADISLKYDTGKRYVFGKTVIKQDFLDDDFFRRYLKFREGDGYSSESLADLQRDLYNSNYVSVINVKANPNRTNKTVPVEITLTPNKNKKHSFSLGYGTDTGPRGNYTFDRRWVNRRGHQWQSNFYVSEKLQKIQSHYLIPADNPATDYYKIFFDITRKKKKDRMSLLTELGGAYHDQRGKFEREFGVTLQQEKFDIGEQNGKPKLLVPYAKFTYRNVDSPLNVKRGFTARGKISASTDNVFSDVSFVQAHLRSQFAQKFNTNNKITLKGAIGKTWINSFSELPPQYRFFTGGDRTVRGYRHDSIGDRNTKGTNVGGSKMFFVSAEYEYFFKKDMSVAAFIDGGDAYSGKKPQWKAGAGIGWRYYSPIGPIRVDVAHGFEEPGEKVRLHINIGPEM